MDYKEALDYIHGTLKFGSKLGLQNITELLKRLDNPHEKFKVVHVAGTNGKGSVTAMTSSILYKAGYKVGMFISPYLERFTERIQVNFREIAEDELAYLTSIVRDKVAEMVSDGYNHPTEFEIVTAIGFMHFACQNVDIAVVEVGLGGRLDATNVVMPEVSVITSISFDHVDILGHTLREIAYEKGGIIKHGVPVVSYPQDEEALMVLKDLAEHRNAPFVEVTADAVVPKHSSFDHQLFDFHYKDRVYSDIMVHLPGKHQLYNAACALSAIMVLKDGGYNISDDAIYKGMEDARWPGRIEKVLDKPLTILDGAHNPSGARALADAIRLYFPNKKIHMIIGILKDKDVDNVAGTLCEIADKVTVTTVPHNPRAMTADELADVISKYISNIEVKPELEDAIKSALTQSDDFDLLLISGSLYLIGEARAILRSH